jgi:hypothetical protein
MNSMATSLTVSGRYISYELEELNETQAKKYIEHGIDSDELDDFSFTSGSETGLIEGSIYQADKIVEQLSIKNISNSKNHKIQKNVWFLVREEIGSISYSPIKIKNHFDINSLNITKYSDTINGHKIEYINASYGDTDFVSNYQEVDVLSIFLVSPTGQISFLTDTISDLREKAEEAFNDGNIETALKYNADALSRQIESSSPNDTFALIIERQQAIFLMEANQLAESEKFFLRNLASWQKEEGKNSQGYANTCAYYANLLMELGRDKEAINFHNLYLKLNNDSFQRYKLAVALKNMGDFLNAKKELLKLTKENNEQIAMHVHKIL